ncbi:hypothetical protein ACQ4PT_006607 [Festuca glaucescens]
MAKDPAGRQLTSLQISQAERSPLTAMDATELAASRDEEAAALLVSAAGYGRGAGAASETRDTHLLSSAFFFVFLAYHAAQNLQSTVNTDGDLGTISLGFLYTSFTAFSVVGSPVVRRMGSRRALVLGTSGYLLFIAANLAPSWYVHTHATAMSLAPIASAVISVSPPRRYIHLTIATYL